MWGWAAVSRPFSAAGIPASPWVGVYNLTKFFGYRKWPQLVWNTVSISLYSLLTFPLPVILALVLHINTHKGLAKVAQNISYIPHFISLVVMIGILNTVLNPVSGFLGYIYRLTGNLSYDDIRGSKDSFRHLYIWSGVWKGIGWTKREDLNYYDFVLNRKNIEKNTCKRR